MSPEEYGRAVLAPTPARPPRPELHPLVAWLLGREPLGTQRDYALAGRRSPS